MISSNVSLADELLNKPFATDQMVASSIQSKESQSSFTPNSDETSDITKLLFKKTHMLESQVSSLEKQLIDQTYLIKELSNKRDAQRSEAASVDFAQWSGILLGSVAIILTVLGIVIAIFSFIGYQKVKDSTEAAARDVAVQSVKDNIHKTTREELLEIFSRDGENKKENENIQKFLLDAVSKIIYRGIGTNQSWDDGSDN